MNGEDLIIEDYYLELTEEPVSVYNFQVEDFHTYFVGDCAVWVHNAECKVSSSRREHILEGEGPNDPGHGPNRGFGNSAFPDTWTDDYAIKAVENYLLVRNLMQLALLMYQPVMKKFWMPG